ncbi:hypothetical protein AAFF_G00228760 [Aldrovandia affinis]|uniref:Uncharacterized protein n=1 Tax=Aldrovandia affinis TaxID=143900 RepID=A0AAD7SVJ8_9TELE|nr:hypothetical protein AAFF_G00228760 [Aldrovandia affinis]
MQVSLQLCGCFAVPRAIWGFRGKRTGAQTWAPRGITMAVGPCPLSSTQSTERRVPQVEPHEAATLQSGVHNQVQKRGL